MRYTPFGFHLVDRPPESARPASSAPLHIVHIAATANGAAWMHQQLRELQQRGHRVEAVIAGRDGSLYPRLVADGIPVHVLDLDILSSRNAVAAGRMLMALVRLLRRLRPDVVHYHLFPSIILGRLAAWAADVPVRISMIPGTYYLEAPVLGDLDLRTAPFDTKVIASCEYTRTLYRRGGIPDALLDLVFYGQDASEFNPAHVDAAAVRRELGIEPDRPVVGDVAYFYPPFADTPFTPRHLVGRGIKGHDVLLRAWPSVLAQVPDALLVLVGEGWGDAGRAYEASLRALAESLGVAHAVRFVGARKDIPATLAACDVSVQCSLNENLGGSIESLLMARPLIASDVGGLPDAVHHERTGLLVPPDDAPALARAIVRLLRDRALATQLGANGRQFALDTLTLHSTVEQLDARYRTETAALAARSPRARRGYRALVTMRRLAWLAPWCWRNLLQPVRRAIAQPPAPATAPSGAPPATESPRRQPLRIIQMAGGIQNGEWLVQICRRLRASGHSVSAIIGWPERSLAADLAAAGVPYGATELSFAQGRGWTRLLVYAARVPWTVLQLARQFRASHVQVVHTHIFNTIMIGRVASWLARVPYRVSMVPGPLHLEAPFTRWLDRVTCWMDHRVIAGSAYTYAAYEAMGLTPPQLQLVRYGVDATRFDPSRANGTVVRHRLGIPADAPVVGLVAYFYPPRHDWQTPPFMRGRGIKGHDTLLDASALLCHTRPDMHVVLAGTGWGEAGERYRQSLIARADSLGLSGRVHFPGHCDDVPDMLASFDVATQCSLSENYGGTIEALLMERPTVATRVGGMPETVRHNETGLLVPPSDPQALATAIAALLDDRPRALRMARAGRQLMLAQFDIAHTAAGIDVVYDGLVNGAAAGSSSVPVVERAS